MPGVIRPYTLTDVLATINDNSGAGSQATTGANAVAFGVIAEVAEAATGPSDTAVATAAVPAGWDSGTWGGTQWQ